MSDGSLITSSLGSRYLRMTPLSRLWTLRRTFYQNGPAQLSVIIEGESVNFGQITRSVESSHVMKLCKSIPHNPLWTNALSHYHLIQAEVDVIKLSVGCNQFTTPMPQAGLRPRLSRIIGDNMAHVPISEMDNL